ncbi:uracil-DNA glycosylase-like protein, partial [Rhizoctonia solani]
SPGQKSAGEGHHFANPLNGFWRCLHQGGLTDVLVPPSEDHTLPERFKLGIINLVDRPSAEMTELSLAERRAAVPGFLRKLDKWRPKIVCMVGKGIWEDVFAYVSKSSKGKCNAGFEFDIQPICLLHSPHKEEDGTLFFVVPSTSSRVLAYQLPDKILLFQLLKKRWEELRTGVMTKSVEWQIRVVDT